MDFEKDQIFDAYGCAVTVQMHKDRLNEEVTKAGGAPMCDLSTLPPDGYVGN